MPIIFIAHRLSEPKTGGEICNKLIATAAVGEPFEIWESQQVPAGGFLSRLPFFGRLLANMHFARKALRCPKESVVLFDTDFSQFIFFAIWVLKAMRSARIVAVCHHLRSSVDGTGIKAFLNRRFEEATARSSDYLITVSAFSLNAFLGLGARPAKHWIISPPISASPHDRTAAAGDSRIKLLTVATIEERKNYLGMIRAIARLDRPFVWRIAGLLQDSRLHAEMVALIDTLSLNDRIDILGRVTDDELRQLYASSDIFYLASHIEGFGIVYGEAMRYGLPIIASRSGATPELVEDGVNGLLCDPASIDDIGEKVRLLCEDHQLGERIRSNNLAKARTFQTPAGFSEQAATAIRDLIAHGCPHHASHRDKLDARPQK